MLAHQGQSLTFWPCVRTERQPNAVSLSQGGAIDRSMIGAMDSIPTSSRVLFGLHELINGRDEAQGVLDEPAVRALFDELWPQIIGRRLKSSRFLVSMDPMSMLAAYHPGGLPSNASGSRR